MKIEWNKCKELCKSLSAQITKNHRPTQDGVIIAVGRGGFAPAVCISHLTGFRVEPIMWQTRDGHTQWRQSVNSLHSIYDRNDATNDFYVVDDINDSGKTLEQIATATNEYNNFYSMSEAVFLKTAVLFQRHSSQFRSNYFGEVITTDEFLIFPWENE